jgi:hypothetical protein
LFALPRNGQVACFHSTAHSVPLQRKIVPFVFNRLRTLQFLGCTATILFSFASALFGKNTRGGGSAKPTPGAKVPGKGSFRGKEVRAPAPEAKSPARGASPVSKDGVGGLTSGNDSVCPSDPFKWCHPESAIFLAGEGSAFQLMADQTSRFLGQRCGPRNGKKSKAQTESLPTSHSAKQNAARCAILPGSSAEHTQSGALASFPGPETSRAILHKSPRFAAAYRAQGEGIVTRTSFEKLLSTLSEPTAVTT